MADLQTIETAKRYKSQRKKRGKSKPRIQPPLTPMIDVTFQLLLFFLLTMEFRQAEGTIPGTLPQKTPAVAADVMPLKPIRITIRPSGVSSKGASYEMSGHSLGINNPQELYEYLVAQKKRFGDELPIIIHPQPNVAWEYAVEAFNQAVRARFKNIGFTSGG